MTRMWVPAAIMIIALAALSGCLDDGEAAPLAPEWAGASEAVAARQATPGSGDVASHGEPTSTWEPVETGRDTLMAYAIQRGEIRNDFGGASFSSVGVEVGSGDLLIAPSPDDDYHLFVEIKAYGLTSMEAERALDATHVIHDDRLSDNGTLMLSTFVEREDDNALFGNMRISMGGVSVDLVLLLPTGPHHGLAGFAGSGDLALEGLDATTVTLATGSGGITITGITGDRIVGDSGSGDVQATNVTASALSIATSSGDITAARIHSDLISLGASSGDVTLDGVRAQQVRVGTSSGDIHGADVIGAALQADSGSGHIGFNGSFVDVNAATSSGDMELRLVPVASGTMALAASSGDISLDLARVQATHAFHVTAQTSSGEVAVDLPGGNTTGDDVELQSPGFETSPVQVVIEAATSSGDIVISAKP